MHRTSSLAALAVALVVAFALGAPVAHAQETAGHQRQVAGNRLAPAPDAEGIINTTWAGVPDHLGWDVGVWLGYENDPLFAYTTPNAGDPLERAGPLVEHRLHGNVVGALALFDWLQLGLDVPFVAYQSRDDALAPEADRVAPLVAAGFGDIVVTPKLRVLRQRNGGAFDLAVLTAVSLPTGQLADYMGEASTTFAPGLAVSRDFGRFRVAANVLHRFRDDSVILGLTPGDELLVKAAVSYRFAVTAELPTEIAVGVSSASATDTFLRGTSPVRNPVELLADVEQRVWGGATLAVDSFVGGGVGIIAGYGVPDFRVLGGVRLSARPVGDVDGDGLVEPTDRCPSTAETPNGIDDGDGCPDEDDGDHDGIPDDRDTCPTQPEDEDGIADADGCPEDDDRDGVEDIDDRCRDEAEDKDGVADDDGCPDVDEPAPAVPSAAPAEPTPPAAPAEEGPPGAR